MLAYKFGAKTIIFGTTAVFQWWIDGYGIPPESYIPELHVSFPVGSKMTIFHKTATALISLAQHAARYWYMFPKLDELGANYLGQMPSVSELEKRASLVLMNSHFSEELPRNLPPLAIPVGGIHCKSTVSALPKLTIS